MYTFMESKVNSAPERWKILDLWHLFFVIQTFHKVFETYTTTKENLNTSSCLTQTLPQENDDCNHFGIGKAVKNDENRTRYFNPKFTSNIFLYQTIHEFGDGQKYLNWNPFLQSLVQDK